LLNCYTKTSDRTRLDAFIRNESSRSEDLDELPFDLDTAIRVCRQAGFFEHATYLAKKYGRHEDYLRIQIEDAQQWDDALTYLRTLGHEAVRSECLYELTNSVRTTWFGTVGSFFETSQRRQRSF
jgi:uncharacterized protein YydD (DUF2326 family)